MRISSQPRLNATATLMLEAYPTKIDVKVHGEGLYDLTLHYLTTQDANIAAKSLNAHSEETCVKLLTAIVFGGSLIHSLQNTFSCQLVELLT